MPDWTYQPIFKPVLFRLPSRKARDIMLGAVSGLANMPFGTRMLDFMGHMHPHGSLAVRGADMEWPCRVGIGAGLALDAGTIVAFSHFGVGHIEVGPVTVSPVVSQENIERDIASLSITYPDIPENPGLGQIKTALQEAAERIRKENKKGSPVRIGVRISNMPGSSIESAIQEYQNLSAEFAAYCDFITVDTRWWSPSWTDEQIAEIMRTVRESFKNNKRPVFILLPTDCSQQLFDLSLEFERQRLIEGFVVGGGISETTGQGNFRVRGLPCKSKTFELVKRLAASIPIFQPYETDDRVEKHAEDKKPIIIASGGIIEPQDAIEFINAGADMIQVHSGFVFAGPGLPKRINECFSYYNPKSDRTIIGATNPQHNENQARKFSDGWIGFALVATGLIISSATVIVVGLTSVLLPYDEAFLGVTMNQFPAINENLLKFMSHDRVTLGGSSLSGAVIFFGLAIFGVRRGHHWAYVTEVAGLTAGFMAFFLYLGFKYFDPLHALVCILVLPFFVWGLLKKPDFVAERSRNRHNDASWHRSQFGQLLFVAIGVGLILAGVTIAGVGCSTIFVKEDLAFMHTSRCTLANVNPHLLPLIAHDRASFGGCLWAVGTVELLTSLYGFRAGNRWVWWMLLLGGLPGFIAVMGIHVGIGYTDFIHLLPAYIAVVMFVVGLYCSHEYLCSSK